MGSLEVFNDEHDVSVLLITRYSMSLKSKWSFKICIEHELN
jgi:hypothetical protein